MFPTAGYFLNTTCPFYVHGLCHRPYCHFKHVKPEKHPHHRRSSNSNSAQTDHFDSKADALTSYAEPSNAPLSSDENDYMRIIKSVPTTKPVAIQSRDAHSIDAAGDNVGTTSSATETRLTSDRTSLSAIGVANSLAGKGLTQAGQPALRVCECDDPDCCGFVKDDTGTCADTVRSDARSRASTCLSKCRSIPRSDCSANLDVSRFKDANNATVYAGERGIDSIENVNPKAKDRLKDGTVASEGRMLARSAGKRSSSGAEVSGSSGAKRRKHAAEDQSEEAPSGVDSGSDLERELEEIIIRKVLRKGSQSSSEDAQGRNESTILTAVKGVEVSMTGVKSLKQRISLRPDITAERPSVKFKAGKFVISKKPSYVSPSVADVGAGPSSQPKSTIGQAEGSYATEEGAYVGRKRQAHTMPASVSEKANRPRVPVEHGSKVPHNLRQKFLDKMIDELTPKCQSEAEAWQKAVEEENLAYSKCTRKQIYLNLCANIIKKIRLSPFVVPSEFKPGSDQASPLVGGSPTVLVGRARDTATTGYEKAVPPRKVLPPPSKIIAPPSSGLVKAATKVVTGAATKVVTAPSPSAVRRPSAETIVLTEESFHAHLKSQYLLSEEEMFENRYPFLDANGGDGLAVIKDYAPLPEKCLKRTCCRCGKEFFMNLKNKYVTRDECHYHWGKMRRVRDKTSVAMQFSCCQGESGSIGCAVGRLHVAENIFPLKNFVSTSDLSNEDGRAKVYAVDCEMCYTTAGLELTRVTLVGFDKNVVMDLFVKPGHPVVDYNTRFSGVTSEMLDDVSTTVEDVQNIFKNLLDKDTILIGHSLESDLKALKLVHGKVVDTSLVFPHRLGKPFKRALRNLMADFLQKIIQDSESGHDSVEDARSCMELMIWKFNDDNLKHGRKNFYRGMSVTGHSSKIT